MIESLCYFITGHRHGPWEDFRASPFEDGRTFEVSRCRLCGTGLMRPKPYDMRRLSEAALLDGVDPEVVG